MDSSKLESFTLNVQKQTPPPTAKGEAQSPIVTVALTAKCTPAAGSPSDHFLNSVFPDVVALVKSDPSLAGFEVDSKSRNTNVNLESGAINSNFRFVATQPAKSAVAVLAPVPSLTLAAPTSPGAPPPKG